MVQVAGDRSAPFLETDYKPTSRIGFLRVHSIFILADSGVKQLAERSRRCESHLNSCLNAGDAWRLVERCHGLAGDTILKYEL